MNFLNFKIKIANIEGNNYCIIYRYMKSGYRYFATCCNTLTSLESNTRLRKHLCDL